MKGSLRMESINLVIIIKQIVKCLSANADWILPLSVTTIALIANMWAAKINDDMAKKNLEMSISAEKLQNNVLCYQLSEKRMQIYTSIKEVLADVLTNDQIPSQLLADFSVKTREVPFFFEEEISKECDEIRKLLLKGHRIKEQINYSMNHETDGSRHSQLCDEEYVLLDKIKEHANSLQPLFKKYIDFSHYYIQ